MTSALFDATELAPRIDRENLSAWFTPAALAWRVIDWCGPMRSIRRVLEPSAGSGRLLEPLLERRPGVSVVAHELAPNWAEHLRKTFPTVSVVEGDYLAAPAPEVRYDLAVMNPPYEGGFDGHFLAKAMDESDRVVAILRLVALSGQDRYRRVWSRVVEGREWVMPGLAILSARPDFGGQDGAKADFCVVKLCRRELFDDARTSIEWW